MDKVVREEVSSESDDVDVVGDVDDICSISKENEIILTDLNSLTAKICASDDEPWEIEEDSSDESDIDAAVCMHEKERKILVANRRLQDTSCNIFSSESDDVDVVGDVDDICSISKENEIILTDLNSLTAKICASDDEPWEIEEDSSDESDIDAAVCMHEKERKILVANRRLQDTSCNIFKACSSDSEMKNLKAKEESNLPTTKKINCFKDDINLNSKLNKIKLEDFCKLHQKYTNEVEMKSNELNKEFILGKNIYNDQGSNVTKFSSSNLLGPSCLTDLPGPSSTTSFPSLSHSLNCPDLPESCKEKELETDILFEFYNKSIKPNENIDTNEDIKVLPLEDCNFVKDLLENNNEDTENSEPFVEDPDIVNPDIMYNIDLNEHYTQMDVLVQKISKTPNDVTLLNECMQLTPIPQIEHGHKTFTAEERLNFFNGVSEWEYDIDRDDWNKIMVKRAAVFTAHSGFSIANEESLYVLADVAIDYIKKLAVIMKNNFDIQSNASYAGSIDPINNSLQEIGVKGGIIELIKHYQNDIFGRRNKLMKKCQHLQKTIDQYVEHTLLDPKIKNQYVSKDNYRENNISEKNLKKDDMLLKEMELIAEKVNIEIQSTNEEVKIDNQSITEEIVVGSSEIEQTEPIYIDNADIDGKIDTDSKNIENIKSDESDVGDRKINHPRIIDTKKMNFNLLKPIIPEPVNTELESILGSSTNILESQHRDLINKPLNRMKTLIRESPSGSENFNNCKKNRKLLEQLSTVQSAEEKFIPQAVKELDRNAQNLQKALYEFDEDFKHFEASKEASLKQNDILSKSTVSTLYNDNFANENLIPTLTVLNHSHFINDCEESFFNENNIVEDIPVLNENENCDLDMDDSYNENDALLMPYNSFIHDLLNLNTLQNDD